MLMGLLDDETVDAALLGTPWVRHGAEIVKTVTFPDFASALAYVNEVGRLAEEADHHPDVQLSWGRVVLRLSTHSVGSLTDRDVDLARQIDQLAGDG